MASTGERIYITTRVNLRESKVTNYPKKEKGDKFGDKVNDLGKIPPKIYSQGNGPVNARMGGFSFVGQCEYM